MRSNEFDHLYNAFNLFIERCVKNDSSLLWPNETIWTIQNLQLLKERFIEAPNDNPELSFEEKLIKQLGSDQPVLWNIIADTYLIYYLPSSSVRYDTKINKIRQFSDRILYQFPEENDPIWTSLEKGFCNTGSRYNQKFRQFWLLIDFILSLKREHDIKTIVEDKIQFQSLLDKKLSEFKGTDRAFDMRHAILYLTFPDYYDPIISSGDKEKIVNVFWNKVGEQKPNDIDKALFQVRNAIQAEQKNPEIYVNLYKSPHVELWRTSSPSGPKKKPVIQDVPVATKENMPTLERTFKFTRNVILYGPPGTGKTYLARRFAEEFIQDQLQVRPQQLIFGEIVSSITVHELIALAMFCEDRNKKYTVLEIHQLELLQARFRYFPIQNERETIWGSLQRHSDPQALHINVASRSDPALFDKSEDSKWYLTKAGIEYVEQNLYSYYQEIQSDQREPSVEDYITWVTFHQSLSYEEFIEGLRPINNSENEETISIKVIPGIFKRACLRASANPDQKFVFVIDEINRGNISRVFGELITLIEDDKRADQDNQVSVVLPYSNEVFKVPSNLYLIGTMNTADRSIALIDAALRRRFAFLEILPDENLVSDCIVEYGELAINLKDALFALNCRITEMLDRDHQIGHSYFQKVQSYDKEFQMDALEFVWNSQILPLLEEYFYGQPEQLRELLSSFVNSEDSIDATLQIPCLEGEDLIEALNGLGNPV